MRNLFLAAHKHMASIHPHEIHIWLTKLNAIPPEPGKLAYLSADELEQAKAFSRLEAGYRYLQTRIEVRSCLSGYAKQPPEQLQFTRTLDGKPLLLNSSEPLHFNISHSGDYLALAITRAHPLGIDLEFASPRRKWRAIAERYFHPDEVAQLQALTQSLPVAEHHTAFYPWWTLKEAFFKALGTGIVTGLDKAIFTLSNKAIRYELADSLATASDWQFHVWRWREDYHLALACPSDSTERRPKVTFYHDGKRLNSTAPVIPNLTHASQDY